MAKHKVFVTTGFIVETHLEPLMAAGIELDGCRIYTHTYQAGDCLTFSTKKSALAFIDKHQGKCQLQ